VKRVFGVVFLLLSLGFCHAREDEFYAKIYPCDPTGPADSCGTSKSGAPMVCFPAKQLGLGSMDFCAEQCDVSGPIDDNFVCSQSARLQKCDPSSSSSGCPSAMGCADVDGDGLCMPCQGTGCPTVKTVPDGSTGSLSGIACDSDHPCGRTSSGKTAICYSVASLGGSDFCAEACNLGQPLDDPMHFTCTEPGALLRRCSPNDQPDQADCPEDFACYRTRLSDNEGVCLYKMHVCASDNDCRSNTNDGTTTCASTLVGTIFEGTLLPISLVPGIHLDHLNCVKRYCARNDSKCPQSQGCLGLEYAVPYADFCVPLCGGVSQCPPNYSCSLGTSGPGSPALCLPGIVGVRCKGEHCVSGQCEDTGAGFSVCATPCKSEADCTLLSSASDTFVCVSGGGFQHCVAPRPFHGANCYKTTDCDMGQTCIFLDGLGEITSGTGHGECRVPCKDDGTCDPRGGLPHTCVGKRGIPDDRSGGCFPGEMGMGCQLETECIAGLSCLAVPPEPNYVFHDKLCTIPCGVDGGTDADADPQCDVPTAINHGGYCGNGFCRARRMPGQPCDRDVQCRNMRCDGTVCL